VSPQSALATTARNHQMATELHKFPPIEGVRWFNVAVLVLTPLIAICGLVLVPLERKTVIFACAYYLFSMIGEINFAFVDLLSN
jgi:hypothetical protein